MTPTTPPRLALSLLRRYVPDNEPLAGDLVEGFASRPSRVWFWRQVLLAIAFRAFQRCDVERPLGLADPAAAIAGGRAAPRRDVRQVNLTASPLPGIGGLGLVALAVIVAMARPEAWWMFVPALAGGVVLGAAMVFVRHRHPLAAVDGAHARLSDALGRMAGATNGTDHPAQP